MDVDALARAEKALAVSATSGGDVGLIEEDDALEGGTANGRHELEAVAGVTGRRPYDTGGEPAPGDAGPEAEDAPLPDEPGPAQTPKPPPEKQRRHRNVQRKRRR